MPIRTPHSRNISSHSRSNIFQAVRRFGRKTPLLINAPWLITVVLLLPTFSRLDADESNLTASPTDYFAEVQDLTPEGDQLIQREVADGKFSTALKSFVLPNENTQALPIPILDRFTTVNAFKLSHSGLVVGFAVRSLGHPQGSQRAFVWNWKTDKLEALHPPALFRDSCAFDISADGSVVSGFIVGRDPPRVIPCVWQRRADDWICQLLPTVAMYNPFLSAGRVVISDDGRSAAASVAKNDEQDGSGNQLRIWRRDKAGRWQGRNATDSAVHLANINNQSMVVGRVTQRGKRMGFVYEPNTGVSLLKPLPGDASTTVTDVNNQGIAIGISDDPPGPNGGSTAFRWSLKTRELEPIEFDRKEIFSTARTIDDQNRIGGWLAWQSKDLGDSVKAGAYLLRPTQPNLHTPKANQE
ncbi:MAG: hypothetical protein P8N76_27265 [Pirellulaceae bacterium]|nr:hypothetical protein [Pirellulaceae bacterium]